MSNRGFFLISDITGYTAFLTNSELEHANDIIQSLLEVLIKQHQSPLTLAKLEGDAIFSYIPDERLAGSQAILDTVESMYAAFRIALGSMRMNTTCTCRACANIPNLDLKFFIHHGTYAIQEIGGLKELSGPDVILIHRLMKNSVNEKTSIKAYALFTRAACQQINNLEFDQSMLFHEEEYEHLGRVPCGLYNLHAFWERASQLRRVAVNPEAALGQATFDIAAPPRVVWDLYTNPHTRVQIVQAQGMSVTGWQQGLVRAGTTYHCDHGNDISTQEVQDWRPFEYLTTRDRFKLPLVGPASLLVTYWLLPTPEGTRLLTCFGDFKAERRGLQWLANMFWGPMSRTILTNIETQSSAILARLASELGYPPFQSQTP